jgi:predicted phosphodiesterase
MGDDDTAQFLQDLSEQVQKVKNNTSENEVKPVAFHSDNQSLVLHRGDDHFGAVVEDELGNEVFNSEIAQQRVIECFDFALETARRRDVEFDEVVLLLGGDLVTNEAIFDKQAFEIDETVDEQITRATSVYISQILRLSKEFNFVKVVCQHGNHGFFEGSNQSEGANADDIIYNQLDLMCRNQENVEFVMSERPNFTNFKVRGHEAHLRHGTHMKPAIGGSRPERDWRGLLHSHGFDIAYRGHYHNHRVENVMGVPVVMNGSIMPGGDYEEKQSLFGKPVNFVHGVTKENPFAWVDYLTWENP